MFNGFSDHIVICGLRANDSSLNGIFFCPVDAQSRNINKYENHTHTNRNSGESKSTDPKCFIIIKIVSIYINKYCFGHRHDDTANMKDNTTRMYCKREDKRCDSIFFYILIQV